MMVCNYCKEKDTLVEIFWIKIKNSLTSKMISDCSICQIRSKSWADPELGGGRDGRFLSFPGGLRHSFGNFRMYTLEFAEGRTPDPPSRSAHVSRMEKRVCMEKTPITLSKLITTFRLQQFYHLPFDFCNSWNDTKCNVKT